MYPHQKNEGRGYTTHGNTVFDCKRPGSEFLRLSAAAKKEHGSVCKIFYDKNQFKTELKD